MQLLLRAGIFPLLLSAATAYAAPESDAAWRSYNKACLEKENHGDYAGAEAPCVAGVKEAERFGEFDGRLGGSLNNLAELYYNQGQYAQAEPLYKRSLADRKSVV